MASAEVLSEDEVTPANLAQVFKRAFLKASVDEDGDLVVQSDGPRVLVTVDEDKKLLKFMTVYGVKQSARLQVKHALANKMNDDYILGRFSIPEGRPDLLIADYYLPYEEGIPAFQIVAALRLFARVVPGAIQDCDKDDLVE